MKDHYATSDVRKNSYATIFSSSLYAAYYLISVCDVRY